MVAPWLRFAFDELLVGVAEVPGQDSNPRINEYLETVGLHGGDETPWCSAFVNWCLEKSGTPGTGKPNARSFTTWGRPTAARLGAVCVLWRGDINGWQGHVGFVVADGGGSITLLGGNQGDRVSISNYSTQRILALRWPSGAA